MRYADWTGIYLMRHRLDWHILYQCQRHGTHSFVTQGLTFQATVYFYNLLSYTEVIGGGGGGGGGGATKRRKEKDKGSEKKRTNISTHGA